ncbi:hypothetical protein [Pedobacter sp. B4-66]|uniref:hypothetical protein n=1 Tax=Pedobacter sp. B4-66 TaxID=2817280 RepID=UPI001BD920D8|nr:hypothetical protein [Pedobacter sp. B4-66]
MTGQELLKKYLDKKDDYSRVVMTALYVESDRIYELLEKAEAEGKKLAIEYPISPDVGPSEPIIVIK